MVCDFGRFDESHKVQNHRPAHCVNVREKTKEEIGRGEKVLFSVTDVLTMQPSQYTSTALIPECLATKKKHNSETKSASEEKKLHCLFRSRQNLRSVWCLHGRPACK